MMRKIALVAILGLSVAGCGTLLELLPGVDPSADVPIVCRAYYVRVGETEWVGGDECNNYWKLVDANANGEPDTGDECVIWDDSVAPPHEVRIQCPAPFDTLSVR
jgi:hypothetical protein